MAAYCVRMAVVVAILAVFVVVLAGIVVVQELRMRAIQAETRMELAYANKNVQMLVELVRKPQETPPDKLINAIGTTVERIISGQPMAVNENVQDSKEEEQPYYPDVEFDEWLGQEGVPPMAGWWSPPRKDESNENIN